VAVRANQARRAAGRHDRHLHDTSFVLSIRGLLLADGERPVQAKPAGPAALSAGLVAQGASRLRPRSRSRTPGRPIRGAVRAASSATTRCSKLRGPACSGTAPRGATPAYGHRAPVLPAPDSPSPFHGRARGPRFSRVPHARAKRLIAAVASLLTGPPRTARGPRPSRSAPSWPRWAGDAASSPARSFGTRPGFAAETRGPEARGNGPSQPCGTSPPGRSPADPVGGRTEPALRYPWERGGKGPGGEPFPAVTEKTGHPIHGPPDGILADEGRVKYTWHHRHSRNPTHPDPVRLGRVRRV